MYCKWPFLPSFILLLTNLCCLSSFEHSKMVIWLDMTWLDFDGKIFVNSVFASFPPRKPTFLHILLLSKRAHLASSTISVRHPRRPACRSSCNIRTPFLSPFSLLWRFVGLPKPSQGGCRSFSTLSDQQTLCNCPARWRDIVPTPDIVCRREPGVELRNVAWCDTCQHLEHNQKDLTYTCTKPFTCRRPGRHKHAALPAQEWADKRALAQFCQASSTKSANRPSSSSIDRDWSYHAASPHICRQSLLKQRIMNEIICIPVSLSYERLTWG